MRSIESRPRPYPDSPNSIDAELSALPNRPSVQGVVSIDNRLAGMVFTAGRLADGLAIFAAGLYTALTGTEPIAALGHPLFPVALGTLLAVNAMQLCRLYSPSALGGDWKSVALPPLLLALTILGVPALFEAAGGPALPWRWLFDWTGIGAAWLAASRMGLAALTPSLLGSHRFSRRVLVVGDPDRAQAVADLMAGQGLALMVGRVENLREDMRNRHIDEVIVALPWTEEARTQATLAVLREYPVDVHLFPDDPRPLSLARGVGMVAGVPMLTLSSRPLGWFGAFVKAAEDRLIALLVVVAISPLLLLIALAIKLDSPGPVLFRQKRYGYNNEVFVVYKFRSMHVHQPAGTVEQARRNDPRITRIGGLLRRSSLDELPQLFNVLGGSMSLVGPRPHAVDHQTYYQHLVDEYRCRHRMKPGITGWAQINGFRGETATVELMRKRVEYDLYYIEHWNPFLDLWILFLTPFACLWGKNAY